MRDYGNPRFRLLVALCRQDGMGDLAPEMLEPLADGESCREFLDLASRHRVLGLTLSVMARATGADDRWWNPELRTLLRSVHRRAAMFDMQRDHVVNTLQAADVRPVILKGAALALTCYDATFERDVADLDILVREDCLEQSLRALESEGYGGPPTRDELRAYRQRHFHIPLQRPGAYVVEIHWALTRPNGPFRLDAEEVLARTAPLERSERPVLFLPRPEHTLLHLVIQNLQEGFSRLARAVDMDRIVRSTPGFEWSMLMATARSGGLAPATAESLQLAKRLLGTVVPDGVLRDLGPGHVARFHLAIMHPVRAMLTQHLETTYAAKRLHELWLLGSPWKRVLLLCQTLTSDVAVTFPQGKRPGPLRRWLRLGKLIALQLYLYAAAAVAQATPSGRARLRFWWDPAGSDR